MIQLFPYWKDGRAALLASLHGLAPRELAWVPPGGRSGIGRLAAHIARVHDRDIGQRLLGRPALLAAAWDPRTAAELAAPLEELWCLLEDYLARSGPEALEERRGPRPVKELLWNSLIEELHHRGQIFMLLRLLGRDPPAI